MLIVDRIEDRFAIVESENGKIKINAVLLPPDIKEGDVIVEVLGRYFIDKDKTDRQRKKNSLLENELWEK